MYCRCRMCMDDYVQHAQILIQYLCENVEWHSELYCQRRHVQVINTRAVNIKCNSLALRVRARVCVSFTRLVRSVFIHWPRGLCTQCHTVSIRREMEIISRKRDQGTPFNSKRNVQYPRAEGMKYATSSYIRNNNNKLMVELTLLSCCSSMPPPPPPPDSSISISSVFVECSSWWWWFERDGRESATHRDVNSPVIWDQLITFHVLRGTVRLCVWVWVRWTVETRLNLIRSRCTCV